jgi:hypothetical protein
MVMVGALGLLGVEWLARLAGHASGDPAEIAWRFGFVAAALVNLRQSNPMLLVLIGSGLALIAVVDRGIRARHAAAHLPQLLGPAVVLYLTWRWYVAENLPAAGEVHFRPLDSWNFDALPSMFESILRYARERPLFHAQMWLVTLAGLAAVPMLRRAGEKVRWLTVITAILWLGYNAFLIFVYLGAFSDEEARWAADYWRYAPHAALPAFSAIVVALARLHIAKSVLRGPLLAGCTVAALAVPFLRSDFSATQAKQWPLFVRGVTTELKSLLPPGAGLVLVLSYNPNPFPVIVQYDLWQLGDPARAIYPQIVWYGEDLARVDDLVRAGKAQYLILHDGQASVPALAERFGVPPPNHELVLFGRTDGRWEKIKSWSIPADALDSPA